MQELLCIFTEKRKKGKNASDVPTVEIVLWEKAVQVVLVHVTNNKKLRCTVLFG